MASIKSVVDIDLITSDVIINNPINPHVDYLNCQSNFAGARFLKECCIKLKTNILTMATAATYYHKFFTSTNLSDYDPFLIACTCIYLASKVKNDDVKIRDIINVGYHTVHTKNTPLSLDPYFELRDSLVEAELLVMRMLNFDLQVDLPHRYLLFFLNALKDWMGQKVFQDFPIIQTCWSILNDIYHVPIVLNHCPQLLAASTIYLTFQIYGISVPGSTEVASVGHKSWFSVLHPSCNYQSIWSIVSEICLLYNDENSLPFL